MLSKLFGTNFVHKITLLAYCSIAFGLPLNKIVLSLATILLAFIVLFDSDFKKSIQKIFQNKILILLIAFICFHFLSLFWTNNYNYFWNDFNSKLPFYALPIVFVLKPIDSKTELYLIFSCFIFSLFITSIVNVSIYYSKNNFNDIRYMSLFLSHIRYGLMIVFGTVLCYFWLINEKLRLKWIPIILIFWFIFYTYISEVFSAYIILIFIALYLTLKQLKKSTSFKFKNIIFISSFGILIVFTSFIGYYFFIDITPIPIPKKNEKTALGNEYYYESTKTTRINETPVYTYICGIELKEEWAKISKKGIFDKNPSGFENYYILIQYMASKGFLKKDAETFKKLNHKDIQNVENGINNCCPEKNIGFIKRIKTLREEIYEPDPNGKTVRQRIEYLKAGFSIFKSNFIYGSSPGDIDDLFQNYYLKTNSHLKLENRLRTHNQIFTYFISFGIIGGLIFVYLLLKSLSFFRKEKIILATIFMLIVILSFFSEDTLETQMGATFFGLFFGLFISSTSILKEHEN
jgi:hypothetical protein